MLSKVLTYFDYSRNINSHFHNVHFQFAKSSFPRMEDSGVADVDIKGITLVLRWSSAPSALGATWAFGLKKARCHIYDVAIHIKAAHHEYVYSSVLFIDGCTLFLTFLL
jgi:hypothetical protein